MRLIPRDEHFFEMFAQLAQRITSSVTLLHELFSHPDRLVEYEARIKDVEHEADELVHQVNKRIDTSFVTPLDREDIHLLATRLDNVVDLIAGFHDSANSIATIVGTRVLSPFAAVVWAAVFNFAAVLGGTAVAKAVANGFIDPNIVDPNLIFAALLGAIVWNLFTWYFGI